MCIVHTYRHTKYLEFTAGQYDLFPLAKFGHALARISKLDAL